jgi:hypothetical protein
MAVMGFPLARKIVRKRAASTGWARQGKARAGDLGGAFRYQGLEEAIDGEEAHREIVAQHAVAPARSRG